MSIIDKHNLLATVEGVDGLNFQKIAVVDKSHVTESGNLRYCYFEDSDLADPFITLAMAVADELDIPLKDVDVTRIVVNVNTAQHLRDDAEAHYKDSFRGPLHAAMAHLAHGPIELNTLDLADDTAYYVGEVTDEMRKFIHMGV